jgi:hypothetical protein
VTRESYVWVGLAYLWLLIAVAAPLAFIELGRRYRR